jgi:uncharacterized protein (DUF305 family)
VATRSVRRHPRAALGALIGACAVAGAVVLAVSLSSGGSAGNPALRYASSAGDPAFVHTPLDPRSFMALMVPHHEFAIKMAQLALRRVPRNLQVKEVATDIVVGQRWEVGLMRGWEHRWYGETTSPRLDLTRADLAAMGMGADLAVLARARPFAPAFYTDMIPHHEAAIVMSHRVLLSHPPVPLAALARSIIYGQSREIARMRRYRAIDLGRVHARGPRSSAEAATGAVALP